MIFIKFVSAILLLFIAILFKGDFADMPLCYSGIQLCVLSGIGLMLTTNVDI